jgi:hypothetical protein
MLIGNRLKELRRIKTPFAGRHRKTDGLAPMLHLSRRKRTHSSGHRDP